MESKNLVLFVLVGLAALFVISSFSGTKELTGQAVGSGKSDGCMDTDSTDIYTKGTVTVFLRGDENQYDDRCSGGGGLRVLENYCDGNKRAFTYEWCPNGMKCSDGECISDASSNYY